MEGQAPAQEQADVGTPREAALGRKSGALDFHAKNLVRGRACGHVLVLCCMGWYTPPLPTCPRLHARRWHPAGATLPASMCGHVMQGYIQQLMSQKKKSEELEAQALEAQHVRVGAGGGDAGLCASRAARMGHGAPVKEQFEV